MKREFKTIEEQIEILKSKGLKFKNEENAKHILLRENYYYLTEEYENVFMDLKRSTEKKDVFMPDTYFEELYAIYNMEREFRNLIFDYINLIETHVKSYVSYTFSKKYGYKDYLKRENFIEGKKFDKNVNKLLNEIEKNRNRNFKTPGSNEKKYLDENGILPLWVLVKAFTFGNITNFYGLMKMQEKEEVAKLYKSNPYSLSQYLKMLNIVRNICAHGDILFNIRTVRRLYESDCKELEELEIEKKDNKYICGTNDLFAIIIIIKKLITPGEFSKMFIKIENILSDVREELDELSFKNLLKSMGFPSNYNMLDSLI